MDAWRERVLARLADGPATLADLRAALPPGDAERRAAMSMGEDDRFGAALLALAAEGRVLERDGRWSLPPAQREPAP